MSSSPESSESGSSASPAVVDSAALSETSLAGPAVRIVVACPLWPLQGDVLEALCWSGGQGCCPRWCPRWCPRCFLRLNHPLLTAEVSGAGSVGLTVLESAGSETHFDRSVLCFLGGEAGI